MHSGKIYYIIPDNYLLPLIIMRKCLNCNNLNKVHSKYCTSCGANLENQLHECPECGKETLVARADDALESFKVRYQNYEELTLPLFDYYDSLGMLNKIDGTQSPDEVFTEILKIVKR